MWRKIFRTYLCILIVLPLLNHAATLNEQLEKLLRTSDKQTQEDLIKKIVKSNPPIDSLILFLQNREFKKPAKTGIITEKNLCIDGVVRPFCWYIPAQYDPTKKSPLLVYLHGSVNRRELTEEPETFIKESPFIKLADEHGNIILFPLGQDGATWWDSVGILNVLQQIRITKQKFNIDDNRVFMTGFSDGGSGSFLFALCYPTDLAGFLPCNGFIGVASIDGGIHTYFVNLFNRPLYVINTDLDKLYPAAQMTPIMELAQSVGANIFYRIYTGIGHDFDYADVELPLMAKFMETHPRYLPSTIKWESADPGLGCMWLAIDSITPQGHEPWYQDYNMEVIDEHVMFGFLDDEKYQGPGVRVDKTVGDSTLCALVGIKEGDIIIKLGNMIVNNLDDVSKYKEDKKCGDLAEITILRQGQERKLQGRFPGPFKYNLFIRDKPSARVEAQFCANKFSVKSSQLGAFTIYIHPEIVKLDQNIMIELNGKKIYDKKVTASPEFILRNFLKNRDRTLIYVNKITITPK